MNFVERAETFACQGETLFGVLALPERPAATGVLIVVGGPQYRAGSHRQFALLARRLAAGGFAALRFDHRGMGDSTGRPIGFEESAPDVGAAVDAFFRAVPGLERVVLWGLCDAAAAALLYCDATADARIAGLCLLNPWVRSEATLARTQVKHYYLRRLRQAEFWKKLLSGGLNVGRAAAELARKVGQSRQGAAETRPAAFQSRMARGLRNFRGQVLLILSGEDYTAKEFVETTRSSAAWAGLLARPAVSRLEVAGADHTFSSGRWRGEVEDACLDWLRKRVS